MTRRSGSGIPETAGTAWRGELRVFSKAAPATGEGRGGSMRFPRSGGLLSKQPHRGQVVPAGDGDPRRHFTQLEQINQLVGVSEANPD